MISAFLIQQERRRGRRVLRQRDGAPEVGDDLVSAGLRPSSAETRSRGKTVEVCGRAAVEKSSQISPKTSVYIGGREGRRQPQNLKVWPKLEVEESYSNPTWSRIPPSHLETLSTLCFFPSQTLWALVGTYSSPLGAGLSLPIAHETPWGVTPLPMVPGTPPGTPGTLPMSPKLFR